MKLALIILSATLLSVGLTAQDRYKPSQITLPSPSAAAIGKFGSVPVSLYNGTPQISIPLYQIKTPNHQIDIGLRYDASGTKAAQDASLVGLGWSLNAGGAVTRIIR